MNDSRNIEVLVVEGQPLTQAGLRSFLAAFPDMSLMGFVDSGESAVLYCEQREPDVILMDLMMPGEGGVAAIRRIKTLHPGIKIVVLTYLEEPNIVQEAMRAGASSYMLKTSSAYELADSIRAAANQTQPLRRTWSDQTAYADYTGGA